MIAKQKPTEFVHCRHCDWIGHENVVCILTHELPVQLDAIMVPLVHENEFGYRYMLYS